MAHVLVLIALLLQSPTKHPDFAGTWRIDDAVGSSVGGGQGGRSDKGGRGGGLGIGPSADTLKITQTDATLIVEERRGDAKSQLTYRLDGKPVTNKIPAGRNAGQDESFVSVWDGATLVTTITMPGEPG